MTREIALSIKGLEYSYLQEWTGKRIAVLQGLDLEIFKGESFGFLGHNGSGKTTTIKNILGLVSGKGSIEIFGKSNKEAQIRSRVGYVPEQPYFYDSLTVMETMRFFAELEGGGAASVDETCRRALERVKFPKPEDTKMRALSKGLNQRVAIAQAIINAPKLLILDEPFSGLDPVGRKDMRDLFTELKAEGSTLFISSHILSDVEAICDRVSILRDGEITGIIDLHSAHSLGNTRIEVVCRNFSSIREQLEATAITSRLKERGLVLEFAEQSEAEKALRIILDSDSVLQSYTLQHPSLEEVFIKFFQGDEQ